MPSAPQFKPVVFVSVVLCAVILITASTPDTSLAQVKQNGSSKLAVGILEAPPFAIPTLDGGWEGLSIDLWHAIAGDLGVTYVLDEHDDVARLIERLELGELDVVFALAVTAPYETAFDLSQPYLTSGLAIAVPVDQTQHSLFHFSGRFFDQFASLEFLLLIGLLIAMAFVAGTLVWFFENRRHQDVFSEKPVKGLWQGLWWAMVTMTTVGYGDKAPRTVGGRVVALLWMFTGIILVAVFTAAVTASLTVGELHGKVNGLNDLYGVRVGSLEQSESSNYLARQGVAVRAFKNPQDGLKALTDGAIDAFVFNELVLKNMSRNEFTGRIRVLPEIFDHYYVSFALPPGSALREPLNRAMLKVMATDEWPRLKARYIGAGG